MPRYEEGRNIADLDMTISFQTDFPQDASSLIRPDRNQRKTSCNVSLDEATFFVAKRPEPCELAHFRSDMIHAFSIQSVFNSDTGCKT